MPLWSTAAIALLMGMIVGAQAAATITVGQRGLVFTRSSASLAKGDRIIFTNEDDVIPQVAANLLPGRA
jgi:hypothetical protein